MPLVRPLALYSLKLNVKWLTGTATYHWTQVRHSASQAKMVLLRHKWQVLTSRITLLVAVHSNWNNNSNSHSNCHISMVVRQSLSRKSLSRQWLTSSISYQAYQWIRLMELMSSSSSSSYLLRIWLITSSSNSNSISSSSSHRCTMNATR